MNIKARKVTLEFVTREKISANIYSFFFKKTEDFVFSAGQYMQLTLQHAKVDDRGSSRFFTISSAPHEQYLMITTTRSQSSFKRAMFSLQKGDNVTAFGPIGTFVLEDLNI